MKENDDNLKRLLHSIRLRNLLSFSPDTPALEFKDLNVLIGPNGSGKSNLIEAITLLQKSPMNMCDVIGPGGGVGERIWKGDDSKVASMEAIVEYPDGSQPIRHALDFRAGNPFVCTTSASRMGRHCKEISNPISTTNIRVGAPTLTSKVTEMTAKVGDATSNTKKWKRIPRFLHSGKIRSPKLVVQEGLRKHEDNQFSQ